MSHVRKNQDTPPMDARHEQPEKDPGEFYLRYFSGRKGRYGFESLEFELKPDGELRYVNSSPYKQEGSIRKEVYVSKAVMLELKRMVDESKILECDDQLWPEPGAESSEELEILSGNDHISFAAAKINSLVDIQNCKDPTGLRCFYYTTQDVKSFIFSLLQMHFRIKPI